MLCLPLFLTLGSFLNVCIYRIPRGESIAYPPSHCPQCEARLRPLELIPVLSWLWQRGRCRHCGQPIPWRYPLVELLTAGLLWLVYRRFGWSLQFVYFGGLTLLLIVISFIDLDTLLIPTELVAGGAAWAIIYNLYVGWPWSEWLLGGLLGYGAFYLLYLLSRGGLGGGDVRLVGLLGVVLGWKHLLLALAIAVLAGALVSVVLLASRRVSRKTAIPFGPFLALGGYLAMLWGAEMAQWYLGLYL